MRISSEIENAEKIPITIGITGHRDLRPEDIPQVTARVRAVISAIQSEYTHSPLCVLSPLAEGADRLVAEVGLEMGASLYTVLPMAVDEYEKDFTSAESLEEFRELKKASERVIRLPEFKDGDAKASRELQYEQAGAYIVRHSQVFLSLWNGEENSEVGGTATITQFRLNGVPDRYRANRHPLQKFDCLPVYHVLTKRRKTEAAKQLGGLGQNEPFFVEKNADWNVLYSRRLREESPYFGKSEKYIIEKEKDFYHRILKRIDDFNHDVERAANRKSRKLQMSARGLFADTSLLSSGLNKIRQFYALADVLSLHYKAKTRRCKFSLILFAVLGFFFLTVFDEILSTAVMLLMFPSTFLFVFLVYKYLLKKNYDNRFNDYRALAEGLRVQFFWKLPGWRENVPEFYLRKFDGEINWISIAILTVSIQANNEVEETGSRACLDQVRTHWIHSQKEYYSNSGRQKTNTVEKQTRMTSMFFLLAMAGVFVIFGIQIHQTNSLRNVFRLLDMRSLSEFTSYHFVLALMDLLVAMGAACSSYISTMACAEEAKQYQRMGELFFRGEQAMEKYLELGVLPGVKEITLESQK